MSDKKPEMDNIKDMTISSNYDELVNKYDELVKSNEELIAKFNHDVNQFRQYINNLEITIRVLSDLLSR